MDRQTVRVSVLRPGGVGRHHLPHHLGEPVSKFPYPLTERDWAVLDCWGSFGVLFVLVLHEMPGLLTVLTALALWWAMVYFQWAAKLRRLIP